MSEASTGGESKPKKFSIIPKGLKKLWKKNKHESDNDGKMEAEAKTDPDQDPNFSESSAKDGSDADKGIHPYTGASGAEVASALGKRLVPALLELGSEVPFVGPICSAFQQFYDAYQTMEANTELLEELEAVVAAASDQVLSARGVLRQVTADCRLGMALQRLCSAVEASTGVLSSLVLRIRGNDYHGAEAEAEGGLLGAARRVAEKVVLSTADNEALSSCTARLEKALLEFDGSLSSWHILQQVDVDVDPLNKQLVEKLDPVTYKSDLKKHLKVYMAGSRAWLHAEVEEWFLSKSTSEHSVNQNMSKKLFWLRAGAGMGKSVFTAALAARMCREHGDRVIGSVFFTFNDVKKPDPLVMLKSLVYQLATGHPELSEFILQTLKNIERESQTVALVFEEVLLAALLKLEVDRGGADQMENMLIMVDALNEAGTEGSDSRKALLDLFSTKLIRKLSVWVKLFVTGRPESDIVARLERFSHVIDEEDPRHLKDLESYISFSIEQVIGSGSDLSTAIALLLRKSGGKFVYTAAVTDEIEGWLEECEDRALFVETFTKRLESLPDGINGCYEKTFTKLFQTIGKEEAMKFLCVLVCSLEPLSEQEVAFLVGVKDASRQYAFQSIVDHLSTVFPLGSARGSDGSEVRRFYPYHKSVVDWLLRNEHDAALGHYIIADRLLARIGVEAPTEAMAASPGFVVAPSGLFSLVENDRSVCRE